MRSASLRRFGQQGQPGRTQGCGYGGTGPATLACLVARLLDGITAYGADPSEAPQAPDGLLELFRHTWPSGTVLTRVHLEAARDGHPDILR